MTFYLGTSSGNKVIGAVTVGTATGNKPVAAMWLGTATGNKAVFAAISVACVPPTRSKQGSSGVVVTDPCLAEVTGGVGPFTYSWVNFDGDTEITATAPTSATTQFSAFINGPGDDYTAGFRVTVTDTGTGLTATAEVNVNIFYEPAP